MKDEQGQGKEKKTAAEITGVTPVKEEGIGKSFLSQNDEGHYLTRFIAHK